MIRICARRRGVSLLETMVGLLILLVVLLLVASLFPTSYSATMQSWRLTAATALATDRLQAQKQLDENAAVPIPETPVSWQGASQGRPVVAQFSYRVDRVTTPGVYPAVWKVSVSWTEKGVPHSLFLAGASPAR